MDTISFLHIAAWFFYAYLLGYAALPLARRLFPALPDGGLAAARVLAILLLSLLSLWLAWLHIAPLAGAAPFVFLLLPSAVFAFSLRQHNERAAFFAWLKSNRRALWKSDALFFTAFAFFLWVRLRHPEINDLEKLMDAAVIGTLARAQTVPPDNPWFAGTPLNSYYYFGHLMTALLSRALFTPLEYAYNLALALFPALLFSTLASLCAALTKSWRGGAAAAFIVLLLGHFEPLRQWKTPVAHSADKLFHLDWWSTSRVIPDAVNGVKYDTINEYPAFTLTIGDAHAHLFAMPLAALLFCLCHALFFSGASTRRRRAALILSGVVLGALIMTHTWDVPLYALLVTLCAAFTLWKVAPRDENLAAGTDEETAPERTTKARRTGRDDVSGSIAIFATVPETRRAANAEIAARDANNDNDAIVAATFPDAPREYSHENWAVKIAWIFAPLPLTYVVALPHLAEFKSRAGGVKFEFWSSPPSGFFLFWSAFLSLWFASLWMFSRREYSHAVKTATAHEARDSAAPKSVAQPARVLANTLVTALAIFIVLANVPAMQSVTPIFATLSLLIFTPLVFAQTAFSGRQKIVAPKNVAPEKARKSKAKRAASKREYSHAVESAAEVSAARDFSAGRSATFFLLLLAFCGLLALLTPLLAYVDDPFFGKTQPRINTVFRFGLQAWLLLGTAAACSAIVLIRENVARWKTPARLAVWLGFAALWMIPAACALAVVWARTSFMATKKADGSIALSLDGARFLNASDRRALSWLQNNAAPGARLIEAPISAPDGVSIAGDYDARCARIASLSGLAAPLGWPQHAMFWGADWNRDIVPRWNAMQRLYRGESDAAAQRDLKTLGADYIFIGQAERELFPAGTARLEKQFPAAFEDGATKVLRAKR